MPILRAGDEAALGTLAGLTAKKDSRRNVNHIYQMAIKRVLKE